MKFSKPKMNFYIMSEKDCLENLKMFLNYDSLDNIDFCTNNIINYFNIDINRLKQEQDNYLLNIIESHYDKDILNINLQETKKEWLKIESDILKILEDIFNVKYESIENYSAIVGINPVCPRFLNQKSFCLFNKNSSKENINVIIHELIHFYWVAFWDEYIYKLPDNKKEFPSVEWAFSELAIDAIITQTDLSNYITLKKPAYDYFYDIKVNNKLLIDIFRNMYNDHSLKEFMLQGIEYINKQIATDDLIK